MTSYQGLVDAVERSQSAMEEFLLTVTDAQLREQSTLPGWTRGHVISHLCRSAGGLFRLVHGVNSGRPSEMYPGGPEARASLIEEGASRPIALSRADFQWSGQRVIEEMRSVPADREDVEMPWREPIKVALAPVLRLLEIEVHRVDFGLGYSPSRWPVEFVAPMLARELSRLPPRAPEVDTPDLPDHELLAWLLGRPMQSGLPTLPAWP